MKIKNATFVEMHLEKVIIGICLVLALVVVLLFVVSRPTVSIGGKDVGPAEVDEQVLVAAQRLKTKLDSNEGLMDDNGRPLEIKPSNLAQQFASLDNANQAWQATPAVDFSVRGEPIQGEIPTQPYAIPAPPIPAQVATVVNAGTLERNADSTINEAYAKLFGWDPGQPRDVVGAVTVVADFANDLWQQRLGQAVGGAPLTVSMQRQAERIAGVLLVRQRWDDLAGEWTDTTVVNPGPEQLAFGHNLLNQLLGLSQSGDTSSSDSATVSKADGTTSTQSIGGRLVQERQSIIQPPAPTLAKGIWRMPGEETAKTLTADDYATIDELRDDIVTRESRLALLEQQYEQWMRSEEMRQRREGNTNTQRPTMNTGGLTGRGGDGRGGGLDMRGGAGTGRAAGGTNQRQDRGQELQQRIADLETEIDGMFNEVLTILGWGTTTPAVGTERPWDTPANPAAPVAVEPAVSTTTQVWAHDFTVEPGNVYRYKLLVLPFNPLYQQLRVPEAQKAQMFDQVVLLPSQQDWESAPWSDDVVVDDDTYYFYTAGSGSQQTATFEVWRFYDGQWRSGDLSTAQGDQLAGRITYTETPATPATGAVSARPAVTKPLDVNTGAIFMESEETTLENTGRQIANAWILNPSGQMVVRNRDDDKNALQRRKLMSLQWLASEPRLQQNPQGQNGRGGMDSRMGDPRMMGGDTRGMDLGGFGR